MSSTSTHSSRVVSMASGTMVSRLTGLFRVLVLAWVLGFTPSPTRSTSPTPCEHALRPGARWRRGRDVHPGVRGTTRARRRAPSVEIDLERGHRRHHRPRRSVVDRVVLRSVDNRRLHGLSRLENHCVVDGPRPTTRRRDRSSAMVRSTDLLLRRYRRRDVAP